MKSFITTYSWERMHYPSEKDDWKKCAKYNLATALNNFYATEEKICPAYVLKRNSNLEK